MLICAVKFSRFPCNPARTDLRDWIDRAASRTPAKPWLVSADDDRTLSYGAVARDHRPHRHDPARSRDRSQRPRRAPGEQFDRAPPDLFWCHGLWRDDLHRTCRDEPQSARQHFRASAAEARAVIRTVSTSTICSPPCPAPRCGSATGTPPRTIRSSAPSLRAKRIRRAHRRRARRRRGDPVHVRHQRAAERRGADISASICRISIRPPMASASRPTTGSMISARSTGPRRSFWARWYRSTAAPRW